MRALQLLFRASPAGLLLLLCLQLRISGAQEDTISRKLVTLDMQMPNIAAANEDITVKLTVETELRECMVIKTRLIGSQPMEGPFTYIYTACLCLESPRTFYWDFQSNRSMTVSAVVDITRDTNICPEDLAVVPISANRVYVTRTLYVY